MVNNSDKASQVGVGDETERALGLKMAADYCQQLLSAPKYVQQELWRCNLAYCILDSVSLVAVAFEVSIWVVCMR